LLCFMTVCMYRDIHTLQPYIIDFTQRGCHTLRSTNALTSVLHTRKMSASRSDHLQAGKNLKHALCRKQYGHKADMR